MSKTYHFIGIKGSGMSALALMLHQMGHKVQGSDVEKYYFTQRGLEQAGIPILPFDEKNITEDVELIAGNAFREDNNVEIAYAIKNGYKFKRYHEFLGHFMNQFTSFGVAGAHGKTSTTGLLSHSMKTSQIRHTLSVMEQDVVLPMRNTLSLKQMNMNVISCRTILLTQLSLTLTLTIQITLQVLMMFSQHSMIMQSKYKKGSLFTVRILTSVKITSNAPIYYYGFEENDDFMATDIIRTTTGSNFKVKHDGQIIGEFHVPAYGRHNILNATAVIANLYVAGFDMALVAEHLKTFSGVKRRFTEKIISDTVIIDDFAHHPTEIIATLDAARQKYPSKEIVAIFQPHTFTRTIALLDDFAEALNEADAVYLAQIYGSAREVDHGDVKVEDLAAKINKPAKVVTVENVSPLLDHDNAVYVFMGAGDIQLYERHLKSS